jgi:hypothetical protein
LRRHLESRSTFGGLLANSNKCTGRLARPEGKAVPLSEIGLMRDEGRFAVRTKNPARFSGRAQ